MKRTQPRKLRDRRTGMSPYARHGKRPYAYSAEYEQWKLHAKAGHVRAIASDVAPIGWEFAET